MCYRFSQSARQSAQLLRREFCRPRHLFAHRHEFFGGARVNADGFVEHAFRDAAFHRNCQTLHDLGGVGAEHVAAEHPLAARIDD